MRIPESKIKEAILHSQEEVRLTALDYFSGSHTLDETIMPVVIRAVEKHGRENAFGILRRADGLPQTEETLRWLTGELSAEWDLDDVGHDNYCFAIALILSQARTDLLNASICELRCFPDELRQGFQERLEMATWGWDAGWAALEQLGRDCRERGDYALRHLRRAERLIESLARHRDQGDLLLPLLHRRYRGRDRNLMEWLEPFIAKLVGRMQLEAAIPILAERLHEDDLRVNDACTAALEWIGGDSVVRTLADQWLEGSDNFRPAVAEMLGQIHTGLCIQKCLKFFAAEAEDGDTKSFLAHALLEHFVQEAVEPIRQMTLGETDDFDPEQMDLQRHLVAACTVMDVSFPEYGPWYQQAVAEHWGWPGSERDRIRENFREDPEDGGEEDDGDELEWEDELDEDFEDNPDEDDIEERGRHGGRGA